MCDFEKTPPKAIAAETKIRNLDGGIIDYDEVRLGQCEDMFPITVRLDSVQGQVVKTSRYPRHPAIENPEIARWLYDQGIVCVVENSPTGDHHREKQRLLSIDDAAEKLFQTNKYIERLLKDHSIRSDTVLWFKKEADWFAFRMRWL